MILLCGRLHQNHIEYYSLIVSLYNVYNFFVTYIPLEPTPKKTILNVILHMKACSSVIIYCCFCWVQLTHGVLKLSSYNIQDNDHCCYRLLYRWYVVYYNFKEPLLVWTTRNVVMRNPHMIDKMPSSNWTTIPLM